MDFVIKLLKYGIKEFDILLTITYKAIKRLLLLKGKGI